MTSEKFDIADEWLEWDSKTNQIRESWSQRAPLMRQDCFVAGGSCKTRHTSEISSHLGKKNKDAGGQ